MPVTDDASTLRLFAEELKGLFLAVPRSLRDTAREIRQGWVGAGSDAAVRGPWQGRFLLAHEAVAGLPHRLEMGADPFRVLSQSQQHLQEMRKVQTEWIDACREDAAAIFAFTKPLLAQVEAFTQGLQQDLRDPGPAGAPAEVELHMALDRLGFEPDARPTRAQVEARYRERARAFHPDGKDPNSSPVYEEAMKRINWAKDYLLARVSA